MKLNARQVETAKPKDKTYKMADGGGLYLEVSAKGSKYWRMKYRRPSDKKEDRLAFGVWPTVTLAQARAKRDEAKKLLVQGIDPKAEQKQAQAENSGAYTFETIAREWHASNKRWSEDHRSRVLRYLELYIFPHIGSSDIRLLKTSHLLAPIKKVDASGKHDVAQRLQQRVTAIMRYAVQNDYIDSNPASDMAGALSTTKVRHYPALPSSRLTGITGKAAIVSAFPCATIISTQAEKLVAMLRRTAAVVRDVERFDDASLVRHIYDTNCIVETSHVDMSLLVDFVQQTIEQDIQRYGNQYPQFCASPVDELKMGLDELANNPLYQMRYQQFVSPMVYGERKITWDEAYSRFRSLALSILNT